ATRPASGSDRAPADLARMPPSASPPGTGLRHRILPCAPTADRGSGLHSVRAPPPRHDQTPGSGSSSAPRNLPAPQSSSATPSPTSPPAPSPAEKSLSAPAAFPVRPIPRDRPAPVHAALPLV